MRNHDGGAMMEVEEPSRCYRFWYYTWKVCTCIVSHATLISLVVSYCLLGAVTFESLESGYERNVRKEIPWLRGNLTEKLWQETQSSPVLIQENWTTDVLKELKTFESNLLKAMKKNGWDGKEDENEGLQWTFSGALFYSIIVITTIGYGHIAPKTHWGKVVTIFYAILGIPLMLLCLSNIGDIMAHSFRFIYWKVCCYVCTRKPKRHHRRGGRAATRQGTIRQQSGGGRGGSGKSRSTSFRRSARTSQRSADSALGLSDSLMTRSSYSDTECRYYDDAGLEVVLTGPTTGSPGANPATAPGIQRLRASSQHSRYSDSTLQVLPPHGAPSNHQQNQQQQPPPSPTTPGSAESPRAGQGPILFNRYAADDSQVPTSNQSSGGSWRRSGQRTAPGIELDALPAGRGDSVKSTSSLPAPAPSQSGINRYQRQGSARLSRLREDEMQDEYLQPYLQYEPTSDPEWDDVPAKPVPIWLCVFLVLSYIIGGAFLFHHWEEWSILDSAYFCFITLTTIGFGDFVPAQRVTAEANANMSIALCSLYLLFGIALLAMSFNLVQEEVINSVKSVARRLGIIKDVDEEEE